MSGWKAAGWGGVCSLGAVSFLRIVAQELERTKRGLSVKEAQAKKEYERRLREGSDDDTPVVIQAVGAGKRGFVARN